MHTHVPLDPSQVVTDAESGFIVLVVKKKSLDVKFLDIKLPKNV